MKMTNVNLLKKISVTFQRGFASVEYVVVTLMVFGALFLPLPGAQGLTAVGMLMAGLRNFQMHTTFLLSLP